jgi:predicted AlkP superfamily pyrophosphatase or phosphodiesterase
LLKKDLPVATRNEWIGLAVAWCTLSAAAPPVQPHPPRLVLVLVVDQFRPDYLDRFRPYFGTGGFNRFLRQGANFTRTSYQHANTLTCPGHAVILTGSSADRNGIVSNQWYDQQTDREEYCAADSSAALLGVKGPGRSPRNLLDSTVGDVLKRTSSGKSRVVTVSGKDRAAIMLGGHLADAAYWMRDTLVVTSTYYQKQLPDWVRQFNASGAASSYLGKTWERLLPAKDYAAIGPDDVPAEQEVGGMGRVFPHRPGVGGRKNLIEAFETSPFHNEVLVKFAEEAVTHEKLGRDGIPDLLAIGLSANDLIGHAFGPDSHEVMDVTIRTDRLLEQLLQFLDQQVGLAHVVVVLTADHGVAPLPEVIRERKPESGAARFDPAKLTEAVERDLTTRYGNAPGSGWVTHQEFPYLYLNLEAVRDKALPVAAVEASAAAAVEAVAGVDTALTASDLLHQRGLRAHSKAERSFYPGRSGNIYYRLLPYRIPETQPVGTTHGSPWPYDTDVPMLWLGEGIVAGTYAASAAPSDIAPTLAVLLGIPAPSGSEGRALKEMLR